MVSVEEFEIFGDSYYNPFTHSNLTAASGGVSFLLNQLLQRAEGISHLFPFGQQFIQNFSVGLGGAVEQDDRAGVDAVQQLAKGFLF